MERLTSFPVYTRNILGLVGRVASWWKLLNRDGKRGIVRRVCIMPVLRVGSHRRVGTQELCRNSGEENKIKRKPEMHPMEMKS